MKTPLLIAAFSFSFLFYGGGVFSFAQNTFQQTYGGTGDERPGSVQPTNDGGYILAGSTKSFGAGYDDVYLVKTASDGSLEWSKTYGGGDIDQGYSVQQTKDSGYIITGVTYSFGGGNVYLVKTSSDGTMQWSKNYGSPGTEYEIGYSVQQTTDDGYVITGMVQHGGSAVNTDVYLVKTAADGALQWTKTFGGTNTDIGKTVQQTTDGGYMVIGYTYSFGGWIDYYLIKTASNGSLQWTKTFGGSGVELGTCGQQTIDGGYVIGGLSSGFGIPGSYFYLVKTASDGSLQWTKTYNYINGRSMQQTADGGYILSGDGKNGSVWDNCLVKTASDGTLQWTRSFGTTGSGANLGIDNSDFIRQTADGGYIILNAIKNSGAGGMDLYLIKTDSMGNVGCNQIPPQSITVSSGGTVGSGGVEGSHGTQGAGGTATTPVTIAKIVCPPCPLPVATASGNITICQGITITLSAGGGTTYSWIPATGLNNSTIANPVATPSSTTTYTVTVSDSCGTGTASVTVTVGSGTTAFITGNSSVCNGQNTTLIASGGPPSNSGYLWSTGATASAIVVAPTSSATYTVTVTNSSGCTATATQSITVLPGPAVNVSFTSMGGSTTLIASGGVTYQWNPSAGLSCTACANPTATPSQTTLYCVTVTDTSGCSDSACITIRIDIPCSGIYLPNAFSPNGDGENDELQVYYENVLCIKSFHLVIYNRWGEVVFENGDPKIFWDGSYLGGTESSAVFTYYLNAKLISGEEINKKGNISLIK